MAWTAVPANGYFLELCEKRMSQYQHAFCGEHQIPGAYCPNCRKPLLRFLTLDLSDPLLKTELPNGTLSLLYCWTCQIAQKPFYYRCMRDGDVLLISYGLGGCTSDFPYDGYPSHFPAKFARLISIDANTQRSIMHQNAGSVSSSYIESDEVAIFPEGEEIPEAIEDHPEGVPREARKLADAPEHQVGGQPLLLDTYWRMRCPVCGDRMPFIASIGDASGAEKGFTDNPYVQVLYHLCLHCRAIGAYQRTD